MRRAVGNNGIGGQAERLRSDRRLRVHTDTTISNFGKINLKRGHRVIEFALKYYF